MNPYEPRAESSQTPWSSLGQHHHSLEAESHSLLAAERSGRGARWLPSVLGLFCSCSRRPRDVDSETESEAEYPVDRDNGTSADHLAAMLSTDTRRGAAPPLQRGCVASQSQPLASSTITFSFHDRTLKPLVLDVSVPDSDEECQKPTSAAVSSPRPDEGTTRDLWTATEGVVDEINVKRT